MQQCSSLTLQMSAQIHGNQPQKPQVVQLQLYYQQCMLRAVNNLAIFSYATKLWMVCIMGPHTQRTWFKQLAAFLMELLCAHTCGICLATGN